MSAQGEAEALAKRLERVGRAHFLPPEVNEVLYDAAELLRSAQPRPEGVGREAHHDFALERVAEELWNAIGYCNVDGEVRPFADVAKKVDTEDPEALRAAPYVRSVREFARRALAAYGENLRDCEPNVALQPRPEGVGREAIARIIHPRFDQLCEDAREAKGATTKGDVLAKADAVLALTSAPPETDTRP